MSDSEEHEKDYALLLEVYKQRNEWARAYMNLRLRHFAAFAIVMVFVATAAFKLDNLTAYRSPILIFGIIVTLLFWLLDYRTGEFLKAHISEYKQIESSFLNLEAEEISNPAPKLLKASVVTNYIFFVILSGWFLLFVASISPVDKVVPDKEDNQKTYNKLQEKSANKPIQPTPKSGAADG